VRSGFHLCLQVIQLTLEESGQFEMGFCSQASFTCLMFLVRLYSMTGQFCGNRNYHCNWSEPSVLPDWAWINLLQVVSILCSHRGEYTEGLFFSLYTLFSIICHSKEDAYEIKAEAFGIRIPQSLAWRP